MPFVRYFKYIVPLQIAIGILNLIVIFTLTISLKIDKPLIDPTTGPPRNNTAYAVLSANDTNISTLYLGPNGIPANESSITSGEGNFLAFEQMSISILAVVGCFVSIVAPYRLKPNYRFCMVWIIAIAGLIAGISQFIMIGLRGGCKARFYSQQVTRCSIQLGVSTVDLVWVAMLLAEGALNYQRSIDKDFQTRRREAEEDGNSERWTWSITSVIYNPDLVQAQRQQMEDEIARRNAEVAEVGEEPDDYLGDVDGNYAVATDEGRNGDLGPDEIVVLDESSASGQTRRLRTRRMVQAPIDIEPLPKYKPKPIRGQPRIIDLGNMPSSPSATSTPLPPPSLLESLSLEVLALPTTSVTITATESREVNTIPGPGRDTGRTITCLPPSYSA